MDDERNEYIQLHVTILKEAMKKEGMILGIVIDHKDANNSRLAFIDKERYLKTGLAEGFFVSITEFNKGLL